MTLRERLEALMDDANRIAMELHRLSGGQTEWTAKRGLRDLHVIGDQAATLGESIEFFFEDPNNADVVDMEVPDAA